MLTDGSLQSADGRTEATTRRRLLHMAATVAATPPMAALTAGGEVDLGASGDGTVSPNLS